MRTMTCLGCRTVLYLDLLAKTPAIARWTESGPANDEGANRQALCPFCRHEREHSAAPAPWLGSRL